MWIVVWLILLMVLYDFMKSPIDRLYFQNPLRPLVGIRNTLIDICMHRRYHDVNDYPGLWLLGVNFDFIRDAFNEGMTKTDKYYFHDLDEWFSPNDKYYYYKVKDFPKIQQLIDVIPCVDKETGVFSVIEGPLIIPPHRAESNTQLRYHLTIESGKDCVLDTENGSYLHLTGEQFLFDHSRYHKVTKRGTSRRVVLILDIHRIQL